MSLTLRAHFLPSLTSPEELADATVVVIDVLRATTTIVHALAAGAQAVVPCLHIKEARRLASTSSGQILLGGERRGLPISGFDLGNSPVEYDSEIVAGQTIVMTTTNGTRALSRCGQAADVLIGAFVNLSALCRALTGRKNVHLLCAGTRQRITREDVLLAGAIADRLGAGQRPEDDVNDQALLAAEAWRSGPRELASRAQLALTLRDTQGGRNLQAIGLQADIEFAAEIDKYDIVPRLDRARGAIRAP